MRFVKAIDRFLDGITMYRLVLYVLTAFIVVAAIEGALGFLPYSPWTILLSAVLATAACWATNEFFARVFNAARSVESVYITAFILVLILPPAKIGSTSAALAVVAASVIAMASKYILAFHKKHLFNPAALGVFLTGLLLGKYASWWVAGNIALLPFVLIGGLAIVRKIRRFDLVLSFIAVALLTMALTTPNVTLPTALQLGLLHTSLLFFAFVMLTEPLTTPPGRKLRIAYGALAGLLFAPAVHLWGVYSSPELALLLANVFSFVVSSKGTYLLTLLRTEDTSATTKDFVFSPDRPFSFKAGQYLEWTLPQEKPDARGTRRYFTIASAPTEQEVRLGVKFYPEGSSFKKTLAALTPGAHMVAAQVSGDFILPTDVTEKLVFIAGGIGITPFRSHVQYLLDAGEKRAITLLYSNRTESDIAYRSVWKMAEEKLGMKTVYVTTDSGGVINAELVQREIPDYAERTFYLSGPQGMVTAFEEMLQTMGVPRAHIKTDYFPGFA